MSSHVLSNSDFSELRDAHLYLFVRNLRLDTLDVTLLRSIKLSIFNKTYFTAASPCYSLSLPEEPGFIKDKRGNHDSSQKTQEIPSA